MKMSIKETFDLAVTLPGTARTASANGTTVDLQNFNAAVALVIPVSWTDGTHALKLQDSPDNSNWTDVAAAQLDGSMPSITSAPTAAVQTRVGYLGNQRYLRAVATVSGTSSGAVYAVTILRGQARSQPK